MNRTANRHSGGARGWLELVGSLPSRIAAYWSGKLGGWLQSAHMAKIDGALAISDREIRALRRAVAKSGQTASSLPPLAPQFEELVAAIKAETERLNRNNVTRTDAYWRIFERRPDGIRSIRSRTRSYTAIFILYSRFCIWGFSSCTVFHSADGANERPRPLASSPGKPIGRTSPATAEMHPVGDQSW